jgi:hypothetical protein
MRMWMIDPKLLCRKHLIGEHGELHKFKHNFEKKHRINKRIELGQIEPSSMQTRHDELAEEMIRRGYNHKSPYEMPDLFYLPKEQRDFKVDLNQSFNDLIIRCEECKIRIQED